VNRFGNFWRKLSFADTPSRFDIASGRTSALLRRDESGSKKNKYLK